jgi:hypothetical protein
MIGMLLGLSGAALPQCQYTTASLAMKAENMGKRLPEYVKGASWLEENFSSWHQRKLAMGSLQSATEPIPETA